MQSTYNVWQSRSVSVSDGGLAASQVDVACADRKRSRAQRGGKKGRRTGALLEPFQGA